MIKLALRGDQLAEFYIMSAIGVPNGKEMEWAKNIPHNQRIYLVDTKHGAKSLLYYAKNLVSTIGSINDIRLEGEFEEIYGQTLEDYGESKYINKTARDFIKREDVANSLQNYINEKIKQAGIDKHISNNDLTKIDIKDLISSFINFAKSIDNDFHRSDDEYYTWDPSTLSDFFIEVFYQYSFYNDVNDKVKNTSNAIKKFKEVVDNLLKDGMFIVNCNNIGVINDERLDKETIKYNAMSYVSSEHLEIFDAMMKELDESGSDDSVHVVIWKVLKDIKTLLNEVDDSGDYEKAGRDTLLKIMKTIDDLSSLSHHGGPAFEYGNEQYDMNVGLVEVMHRKLGDRFIPWALSLKGFIEDKELKSDIKQWYEESVKSESHQSYLDSMYDEEKMYGENAADLYNRVFHREDYYDHPYHRHPEQWEAEQSETFKSITPYNLNEVIDNKKYPNLTEWIQKSLRSYGEENYNSIIENLFNIISLHNVFDNMVKEHEGMSYVSEETETRMDEIGEFLHWINLHEITDEVIEEAERFFEEHQRSRGDLTNILASLDKQGMYVQADGIEKLFYIF